jgi:hypothetical protein
MAAVAAGADMLVKMMLWSAVLCAVIGMNSADGNLFFFFTVHLTMLTVGYAFYRREKRVKPLSSVQSSVPGNAVSKTKTDQVGKSS